MGSIEVKLNWIVGFLFVFLALVVIITAVVSGTLQGVKSDGKWYMGSKRLVSGVKTTFIGLVHIRRRIQLNNSNTITVRQMVSDSYSYA